MLTELIVRAAMPRYGKLGKNNQLQSWHKVFVPAAQMFEWVHCAPAR
ncbi:hypothetical protein ABIC09_007349 [Bradyrhizobium sp. S3.12.5]